MTIDETWVGEALRPWAAAGCLRAVTERPGDAFNSDVRHLELSWEGASPEAPTAVVWKRGHADDREVEVWRLLRTERRLPVPRCFAADDRGLLLEDLTATHCLVVCRDDLLAGRGVPPGDGAERIVEALADFHAVAPRARLRGGGDPGLVSRSGEPRASRREAPRRAESVRGRGARL